MRKYRNKLFAILLSVLAALSFTSCDDYEWREAQLIRYSTINAAPNGTITENIPIDFNHVRVNGGYDRIDDIRFYGGQIEIKTDNRVGILRLSISNSNASLDIDGRRGGGIFEGARVDDFLYAIVETVRRDGYATIYVDGDGYADRYARFDLNFFIDIDAYVSY